MTTPSSQVSAAVPTRPLAWLACGALLAGCSAATVGARPDDRPASSDGAAGPGQKVVASAGRRALFISDLHLGYGRGPQSWTPHEDFRWAEEFESFLAAQSRQSAVGTELVLLGDTFELWEPHEGDCSAGPSLGCTEAEAVARLNAIVKAHPRELAALRKFADEGANRIVVVVGNHDGALLFPAVARAAVEGIGAAPGRVVVATAWESADGRVLADHGHQFDRANRFALWPEPFRKGDSQQSRLDRPWGEQFVREFYAAYEERYPIIDNLASVSEGIRLGIAHEGAGRLPRVAAQFLGFMLLRTSWNQKLGSLGDQRGWDVNAAREQGLRFFADSAKADETMRAVLPPDLSQEQARQVLAAMSDADIAGICQWRAKRAEIRQADELEIPPQCPTRTLGAEGGHDDGTLGAATSASMSALEKDLAAWLNTYEHAQPAFYLFGHTHAEHSSRDVEAAGRTLKYLNTGAWQRVVSKSGFATLLEKETVSEKDALVAIPLEKLPACYSFVVAETEGAPALRFWAQHGSEWKASESCPGREEL